MKFSLVTDGDSWAIKKTSRFWILPWIKFESFYDPAGYWWGRSDRYFRDCWMKQDYAQQLYKRLIA